MTDISVAIAIIAAVLFVVMLVAAKAAQARRREQLAEDHDIESPDRLSNEYFYERWK